MSPQVLLLELQHPLGVRPELLGRAVQEDPVPHRVGVHALPFQLLVGQVASRHPRPFGHGCSVIGIRWDGVPGGATARESIVLAGLGAVSSRALGS